MVKGSLSLRPLSLDSALESSYSRLKFDFPMLARAEDPGIITGRRVLRKTAERM